MEKELLKKIYNVLVIICIVLVINTFVLIFVNSSSKPKTTEEETETSENTEYDVSKFNKVTLQEVLDLFDEKGTYLVYVGRPTCSACKLFVPYLNTVSEELDLDIYYYDSTNLTNDSATAEKLKKLMTTKYTLNSQSGSKTGEFGSFLGTTPMFFIIKDGKFKDGFYGAYDTTALKQFLSNNGIK